MTKLTRRMMMTGMVGLPGCTALTSLNEAATPQDVYDLNPVSFDAQIRRTSRTLLVLEPTAPAAIDTDSILIRPNAQSIAYMPDARWSDDVPLLVQSLLIRSLAGSGQVGFVGPSGAGPVPDMVLITRIDRFGVDVRGEDDFEAGVTLDLTVLRDSDQRIVGSRIFQGVAAPTSDEAAPIAMAFQQIMDATLPEAVQWIGSQVAAG